jgi:hypothetical protein
LAWLMSNSRTDAASTIWFPLGDLPAMIAGGEIRAASTSAAVLMIGSRGPG